jgi:hypothetical protein
MAHQRDGRPFHLIDDEDTSPLIMVLLSKNWSGDRTLLNKFLFL